MAASEEALKDLIREYGFDAESCVSRQLHTYLTLLRKWNTRVNLASSTEWDVIGPLFQEGLWAAKFYPAGVVRHLDIGSGGGFPAIVLKILMPEIRLDLVESRAKKGIFLETAAAALGFSNTRVHTKRLEMFLQQWDPNQSWDCVSWKALKLSREDIESLLKHAHQSTQFWIFHGRNLAVEDPTIAGRFFKRFRTESLPARRNWNLSIFLPK